MWNRGSCLFQHPLVLFMLAVSDRIVRIKVMSSKERRITIIESPFSAPSHDAIVRNVRYAMLAVRDSLSRGEAPYASHLFFTQMLDDNIPEERALGIDAGLSVGRHAALTAIYTDFGLSRGMEYGITAAKEIRRPVVERKLFGAALSTIELEELVHNESLRHNLPDPDTIAAIYARIIK